MRNFTNLIFTGLIATQFSSVMADNLINKELIYSDKSLTEAPFEMSTESTRPSTTKAMISDIVSDIANPLPQEFSLQNLFDYILQLGESVYGSLPESSSFWGILNSLLQSIDLEMHKPIFDSPLDGPTAFKTILPKEYLENANLQKYTADYNDLHPDSYDAIPTTNSDDLYDTHIPTQDTYVSMPKSIIKE